MQMPRLSPSSGASCMLLLLACGAAQHFADAAIIAPLRNLVVFGDSISDTGAGEAFGNHHSPEEAWGTHGRYVEADSLGGRGVWVDQVRRNLNLNIKNIHNYAIGGATACGSVEGTPGGDNSTTATFLLQLAAFNAAKLNFNSPVTTIVMIGTNDILYYLAGAKIFTGALPPQESLDAELKKFATCLSTGIQALAATPSLRNTIIYTTLSEPLERLPIIRQVVGEEALPAMAEVANQFNSEIRKVVAATNKALAAAGTPVKVNIIDTTSAMRKGFANPPPPINNTVDTCLESSEGKYTVCSSPSTHAFFDSAHYTSLFQTRVIAPAVVAALRKDKLIK